MDTVPVSVAHHGADAGDAGQEWHHESDVQGDDFCRSTTLCEADECRFDAGVTVGERHPGVHDSIRAGSLVYDDDGAGRWLYRPLGFRQLPRYGHEPIVRPLQSDCVAE
jgi:hypothetical protein